MGVRDHLPSQQGLRLVSLVAYFILTSGTRPSSITTRIKTYNKCHPQALGDSYETIFHHNKD